jgi:hypothetical protein
MLRLALFALVFGLASASHFRFATISWEKGKGNHVRFTIETAWRRSYDGNVKGHGLPNEYKAGAGSGEDGFPVTGDELEVNGLEWPTFDTGDGHLSYLTLTVAYYSVEEDWIYGVSTVDHTYLTPSDQGEPWVAKFTGCCRLSNLMNNKDRTWSVQSKVNLLTEEYSAHVKSLPIISVPSDKEDVTFYIPATNPNNENNNLIWRTASFDEMGGTSASHASNPAGLEISDEGRTTGEITFNTATGNDGSPTLPGLYNVGLIIESGHASTPVDFLIRVIDQHECESCEIDSIPVITNPLDVYPNTMKGYVGFEVETIVKASDNDASESVGFTWGVLPVGAKLGTIQQQAAEQVDTGLNPVQMKFLWTPCNGQQGVHIVCFEAVDENGNASVQRCIKIDIESDPAPYFLNEAMFEEKIVGHVGQLTTILVEADDKNCHDEVDIDIAGQHPACDSYHEDSWPAGAELMKQVAVGGEQKTDACSPQARKFQWNPAWDQGGWTGDICFKVTDSIGKSKCEDARVVQKTEKCIHIEIARCRYTVQYEQQLQEIAAIYATDWISLWMVNPEIDHPDYVLHTVQDDLIVWTGHVYSVNIRDNLYDIAERFGTSVEWLHHMNADLCADHSVDVGQKLCIISNPCDGAVDTPYGKAGAKDNFWYSAAKDAYQSDGTTQTDSKPGHK